MPIDTDSEAWDEAESGDYVELQVLEFLRQHPDKAFRLREIVDAVIGTEWYEAEEHDRLMDELGDEYYEQYSEGDHATIVGQIRDTDYMAHVVRDLERRGLIEAKSVSTDAFNDAYMPERERVRAYTYSGPFEEFENDDEWV